MTAQDADGVGTGLANIPVKDLSEDSSLVGLGRSGPSDFATIPSDLQPGWYRVCAFDFDASEAKPPCTAPLEVKER